MKHIKQNTSGLYLEIQKIGCFFIAALNMAQDKAHAELDVPAINKLWRRCLSFGFIDKKLNVVNSARIGTLALRELGDTGFFVEVATFRDGHMGWYNGVEHKADYYIQKIEQNGPSKYHYRNVDKYGNLLEDPHDPEIKCQGVVYTICYRYDKE